MRKSILRFTRSHLPSSILLLLAPICPFITEALWLKIYSNKSIHSGALSRSLKMESGLSEVSKNH